MSAARSPRFTHASENLWKGTRYPPAFRDETVGTGYSPVNRLGRLGAAYRD
jgi:hypothetical protein